MLLHFLHGFVGGQRPEPRGDVRSADPDPGGLTNNYQSVSQIRLLERSCVSFADFARANSLRNAVLYESKIRVQGGRTDATLHRSVRTVSDSNSVVRDGSSRYHSCLSAFDYYGHRVNDELRAPLLEHTSGTNVVEDPRVGPLNLWTPHCHHCRAESLHAPQTVGPAD